MLKVNSVILVILAAILGAIAYNHHRLSIENKELKQDVSGLNDALKANIDTTRNNYNQMRAQTETIVLSGNTSKQLLSNEIKDIKTSFGVKLNGIESYAKAGTKYNIPIVVKSKDTVIINKVEKIYHIEGRYKGMLFTQNDSLKGQIFFQDTIRIAVSKGKRKSWWKVWEKRPLVTNAFMSNPNGSITELKSVTVK
jgi:hypothetical protein